MRMNLSGEREVEVTSPEQLSALLAGIADGGFAILSRSDDHFAQAAFQRGGWVIEMREGGEDSHVAAAPPETAPAPVRPRRAWWEILLNMPVPTAPGAFQQQDVKRVFAAYLANATMPADLRWKKLYA